ncbi:zinc finger, CCHC-type [Senna tora]|uniref:Zinc finger, CCHC-type n=1 Tax=Senna tora TaxID=362788 RepID=A0A834SJH0_9FABA|nr:zinc finger, CCHC-type [Senna tora]
MNLKHKKEDISLEQLGNHLCLEEEYRKQDAKKETNVQEKVHMVEEGQSNRTSKKRGKDKDKSQAHDGHKNKKMKAPLYLCWSHLHSSYFPNPRSQKACQHSILRMHAPSSYPLGPILEIPCDFRLSLSP